MELSEKERWILSNQHRILEHLDSQNADYHRQVQKVLTYGFTLAYRWVMPSLHEEVSGELCKEVAEILDLHRALHFSADRIGEIEGVEEHDIEFWGFDGNEESEHLSFAGFLIRDQGKWQELSDAADDLNSHAPTLYRYRAMLRAWEQLDKKHELSEEEVRKIADAGRNAGYSG